MARGQGAVHIPGGDLDLVAIGETVVDLISVEETDRLRDATTFRKYQGGSPANVAVVVAKLGGVCHHHQAFAGRCHPPLRS